MKKILILFLLSATATFGVQLKGLGDKVCPPTIKCKVGQQTNVTFSRQGKPANVRNKLHCYYRRGFINVSTNKSQCKDVPITSCSGHLTALMRLDRRWVGYRTATPVNGKCNVKPNVNLKQKK